LPPYLTNSDLPLDIRLDLPPSLQVAFRYAFNLSWRCRSDALDREAVAMASGWEAVTSRFRKVGTEWYPKETSRPAASRVRRI
jgi:cation transport regulator ChaB